MAPRIRRCFDCDDPFPPNDPRQQGRCPACKRLGEILLALHSRSESCEAEAVSRELRIELYAAVVERGGLIFGR